MHVVGADVAAHSRPLEVRGTDLVVGVDDPAWSTQLRLLEATVLDRIRDRTGDGSITRLKLRVQPL